MKILFLGQCLQYGYSGVSRYATYPNLAATALTAQFPNLGLKFDFKYLYHPTGLKALLQHRLLFTRPDIAVITLPAAFAATRWRVNLVYQIAPELVDTARTFMRKIEAKAKRRDSTTLGRSTMIDKVFALQPLLTLDEYERLVEEALLYAKQISTCRIVLMGAGRFNEDSNENYELQSPELWSAVNQMVLRLAARLGLPVINMQGVMTDQGYEVFIPNNHRPSEQGHQAIAREVVRVLTREIAMSQHNPI